MGEMAVNFFLYNFVKLSDKIKSLSIKKNIFSVESQLIS